MPVIKSAKKKLRKDKKRTLRNNKIRTLLDAVLKKARKNPSVKTIQQAAKIADKAAKNKLIHKNKAARIKSTLSKLIAGKKVASPKPVVKKKRVSSSKAK